MIGAGYILNTFALPYVLSFERYSLNMANPATLLGTWPGDVLAETIRSTTERLDINTLVHDYARHVHAVAYSVVRDHHDAEDVAQETFLRVLRQKVPLTDVENPRAWLGRIAYNLSLDRIRDRKRRSQVSIDDETSSADVRTLAARGMAADDLASQAQMQKLLAQMIASLPEEMRHTLQLSLLDGMNSTEVAKILDLPDGTVRTRLMRARQMLKEKLKAVMEPGGAV